MAGWAGSFFKNLQLQERSQLPIGYSQSKPWSVPATTQISNVLQWVCHVFWGYTWKAGCSKYTRITVRGAGYWTLWMHLKDLRVGVCSFSNLNFTSCTMRALSAKLVIHFLDLCLTGRIQPIWEMRYRYLPQFQLKKLRTWNAVRRNAI